MRFFRVKIYQLKLLICCYRIARARAEQRCVHFAGYKYRYDLEALRRRREILARTLECMGKWQ